MAHPTQHPPILVGFAGSDADWPADDLRGLADRVSAAFEWLDHRLPNTPKVLLCGCGCPLDRYVGERMADGIAADTPATRRWSLVWVRAWEGETEETSLPGAKTPERVRTWTLRPPKSAPFDDAAPDSAHGLAELEADATVDLPTVGRLKGTDLMSDQRDGWLARVSTVLFVAAGVDDQKRAGRVAAFRRTARDDERMSIMLKRSVELFSSSPLDDPDAGHVFWIDATDDAPKAKQPPFVVLRPIPILVDQHGHFNDGAPGHRPLAEQVRDLYRAPFKCYPEETTEKAKSLSTAQVVDGALTVAAVFERLNGSLLRCRLTPRWLAEWFAKPCPPDEFVTDVTRADYLSELRNKSNGVLSLLSIKEGRLKTFVARVLILQVSAAFLAIFALEMFAEVFKPLIFFLITYLGIIVAIGASAVVVNLIGHQRHAEDLRGVKEVLRVQIAWWQAGIDRMVDRVHLRSIDSDLSTIRDVSATLCQWAALRTVPKHPDADMLSLEQTCGCDGEDVMRSSIKELKEKLDTVRIDWIISQANFYFDRWNRQRGIVRFVEHFGKVTLLSAVLCLGLLIAHLWFAPEIAEPMIAAVLDGGSWTLVAIGAWLATVASLTFATIRHVTGRWPNAGRSMIPVIVLLLGAIGLLLPAVAVSAHWSWPGIASVPVEWPALAAFTVMVGGLASVFAHWPEKFGGEVGRMGLVGWIVAAFALTVVLIGFEAAQMPYVATLWSRFERPVDAAELPRAFLLATSVLLLSAAGLVRLYAERQNYKAQATEYNNANRAFTRMADLAAERLARIDTDDPGLAAPGTPGAGTETGRAKLEAIRDLRRLYVDLGELALDENESWLQAHRERPMEAIAGS